VNTPLTLEEIITETLNKALKEELPPLIEQINHTRKETWLTPPPEAALTLGKVIKEQTQDNFNKTTYHITLKLTFKDNSIRNLGYRYHYALSKLLKESPLFPPIADTCLITEMTYNKKPRLYQTVSPGTITTGCALKGRLTCGLTNQSAPTLLPLIAGTVTSLTHEKETRSLYSETRTLGTPKAFILVAEEKGQTKKIENLTATTSEEWEPRLTGKIQIHLPQLSFKNYHRGNKLFEYEVFGIIEIASRVGP